MAFLPNAFARVVSLVAILFLAPGCATFWKKKGAEEPEERKAERAVPMIPAQQGPQRIGLITLVNKAENFVLIDTGLSAVPAVGTALKSFTGDSASGVVTVGNVNRRPFVVADIVQGNPAKGDAVFQ